MEIAPDRRVGTHDPAQGGTTMWSAKVQGNGGNELHGINHSVHKALMDQAIKAKKPVPAASASTPAASK
jgi:hypothetical protein